MRLNTTLLLIGTAAIAAAAASTSTNNGSVGGAQQRVAQVIAGIRHDCLGGDQDCESMALARARRESENPCIAAGLVQFDAGEAWNELLAKAVVRHGTKSVACLLYFREHPVRVEVDTVCHTCGGPFPWRIGHAERRNRYNPLLQRITGMKAPWLPRAVAARVEELVAALPATAGEEMARDEMARWYGAIEKYRDDQSAEADAALAAMMDFAGDFISDIEFEICARGARMAGVLERFQRDPQFAPKVDAQAGEYERFWRFQELIDSAKGGQ